MTGISKNFYKFSSLLAVVAMFLGLMVTGCSEGDNTPATVNYDASGAGLDVIVGLLEDEAAAKGFDCDANAARFVVGMLDADNAVLASNEFAAEEVGEVAAWTVLSDGALMMSSDVDEDNVESVAKVVVSAFDADGNILGVYCDEDVVLTAGKTVTVDFTADDAPEFIPAAELSVSLELTSEPAAEEDVVTIAVDETATVTATQIVAITEETSVSEELDADEFTLTTESEDITIEGNVITGVNAAENIEVTATSNAFESATATLTVTVTAGEGGFEATADPTEIEVGGTSQITVTLDGEEVTEGLTFTSSDEAIATVDEAGLVTGVAEGTATITVTDENENEATVDITVAAAVGGFVATADPTEIEVAGTTQITVTLDGEEVTEGLTFTSSDEAIATVDEAGLVTGVAEGTATITVTDENENEATVEITVAAAASEFVATAALTEIEVDGTSQITVTLDGEEVTEGLTFTSSDEAVATVDADGLVTGVADGVVTITVTDENENEATVEITVGEGNVG